MICIDDMRNIMLRVLLVLSLLGGALTAQTASEPRAIKGGEVTITFKNIPTEDAPTVNGSYPVNRADGTIAMPYLSGRVSVVGKTAREVEQLVRTLYMKQQIYADPIVQASVIKVGDDLTERKVLMSGYVASRRNLKYREDMTLIEALIECGDITDFGSRWIQVTRGNDTRKYDYFSARDRNIRLLPNDKVYVPKRPAFESRPSQIGP